MIDNKTYPSAFPENIEAVRYDLEHKDIMLSARLVDAAVSGSWSLVSHLLADGADPRICRYNDGGRCGSALFFALKAKEFGIARALLEAGDRLDDLRAGDSDALPGDALNFLVRAEACGTHVFSEKDKPLSECIRCGLWAQAREAMKRASRKELNLSIEMICLYLQPWNAEEYLRILDELEAHGAIIELIASNRDDIKPAVSKLLAAIQAKFMERIGKFIAEEDADGQRNEDRNSPGEEITLDQLGIQDSQTVPEPRSGSASLLQQK